MQPSSFGSSRIAGPATSLAVVLALVLCCAKVDAQTTWIVDAAGGPGSNFTDLPAAVSAASDGDILRIRPGSYSPFSLVGKGLRLIGDDRNTVRIDRPGTVDLSATAPGQRLWIEGVSFAVNPGLLSPTYNLSIHDTAGEVVLHDVLFDTLFFFGGQAAWSRIELRRCAQVHLHRVAISGVVGYLGAAGTITGIDAQDTYLSVEQSYVAGTEPSSGGSGAPIEGAPGIRIVRGELFVVSSTVLGAPGSPGCLLSGVAGGRGGPGIRAQGQARVVLCGRGATDRVQGGPGGRDCSPFRPPQGDGGPGIELTNSTASFEGYAPTGGPGLQVGPTSVLLGASTLSVDPSSLPPVATLAGIPAPLSRPSLQLDAAPSGIAFLALALEHRFVPVGTPGVGELLIASTPAVLLGPHAMNGPVWDIPFDITPVWPMDFPLLAQFLVIDGSEFFFSNAVAIVLRSP